MISPVYLSGFAPRSEGSHDRKEIGHYAIVEVLQEKAAR